MTIFGYPFGVPWFPFSTLQNRTFGSLEESGMGVYWLDVVPVTQSTVSQH